jgi:hypothetical protein
MANQLATQISNIGLDPKPLLKADSKAATLFFRAVETIGPPLRQATLFALDATACC